MLRVSSISRISSLYPSILSLLYSTRGPLAALLRVRSISRITLGLLFQYERERDKDLIDTPFQILKCRPRGFVEITDILLLDCGLECLEHVETVVRELDGIFVCNHLVLVGGIMRPESPETDAGRGLTRTKARMEPMVLNIRFAGESSAMSLSRIWILSSRSETSALRLRVAIPWDLV